MGLAGRAARRGGAVLVALLVIGLVLWRWSGVEPVSAKLEGALLDLRFRLRGPLPPPESVVIVAIDEPALDRIGAYEPLRAAVAEALGTIAAARPRVVALDILLVDRTDADAALAEAIRSAGPVLLAAGTTGAHDGPVRITPEQEAALTRSALPVVIGRPPEPREAARLILPNPQLAATGLLAHVNVAPDDGGAARALPLSVPVGDARLLPSMALVAARFGLETGRGGLVHWAGGPYRIGGRTVVPDERGRLVLDHYGGPGTIPTVGLLEVLDGRAGALGGRVVFVGSTAPSLRDAFATPFGAAVAGVEILATATANIVEGRTIRADRGTFGLTALLGLGAAMATFAAFRIRPMALAVAAAVACWLAALAALQAAFAWAGLWLDGFSVLGGLVVATAVGGWSRLRHESRGRQNLAHYVAPSLVRLLSEQARPGFDGREQAVGILFVDVAGYSGMVEAERPAEIADFLRALHGLFEEAAERHGGVIVDFQGDGALLVFGLPEPGPDDAASALACGEMLLAGRGAVRAAFAHRPIELRVSVHWGPVAVGVLGGRRHAKVSVTGDAVNVTARLQEIAKAHGVPFVATRAALDAAGAARPGFRPLATEPLRGRRGDVEIWGWSGRHFEPGRSAPG